MSELVFTYEYAAGDDFGRLKMVVTTERYSGRGGFWVQWQDVQEFAELLDAYPIDPKVPLQAQWGYEMQEGDDLILSVGVMPANLTGDLLVQVEVADEHNQYQRVRASFVTNYPDLNDFRLSIVRLMDREVDRAVLIGR
jgi:hypothetical protein